MKHKILVVDDEISVRTALGRIFHDFAVLSAKDGAGAMRLIESERPSLVLLDLNMPGMSGYEVLLAFRNAADPPLFIILTGNEELEAAQKALETGALGYLTKPFTADAVRDIVLYSLESATSGVEPGARPWRVKRTDAGN